MENQPVCHIYQWVAHPTHGGVWNHCERMMDGLRLDDVIALFSLPGRGFPHTPFFS